MRLRLIGIGIAAALIGAARGQEPAAGPGRDLATRYRLVEAYSDSEQVAVGQLTEYEVAFRETVKATVESAEAPPRVEEVRRAARYAERPLRVGLVDSRNVSRVLRRYEEASVTPDPWGESGAPALMSGLELVIEGPATASPRMIVLSGDRPLWEHEYRFAAGNPLMPALASLLPDRPLRLGDPWTLSQAAAAALLGQPVESGAITGELSTIRPAGEGAPGGAAEVAVLELEGRVTTPSGPTAVRSRVEFAFRIAEPAAAVGAVENPDRPLVAAGGITSLRHVQVSTIAIDAEAGTPGFEQRRELLLERRWPIEGPPLLAPGAEVTATPQNSWLLYADSAGRFHFRHPQGLQLDPAAPGAGPDRIMLVQRRGEVPDMVAIAYLEGEPPRPEEAFQASFERYEAAGFEVLPLDPRPLPAEDWPGMTVHRVEAALTPPADAPTAVRTHIDGYLLRTGGTGTFQVMALTTSADQVQAFRALVEDVLKTLATGRP
jgi:hypothetical protein